MYNKINWRKGAFSSQYKLYSNNLEIGDLTDKSFSQKAEARINDKSYRFETKGFFNQVTDIIDNLTNTKLGTITYNTWKTSADININGQKEYTWKTKNSWKTTGTISQNQQKLIEFKGNPSKGEMSIHDYNELLILTGLYVSNYYWQSMVAIFIAVFIPIWVSVLN